MVQYFYEKQLSFGDIFIICSGLRHAVLKFFLEAKMLDTPLFCEINGLFDLNFEGVIREYKMFYDIQPDLEKETINILPIEDEITKEEKPNKTRTLNIQEQELLHKTQINVIDAKEYVGSLDVDTLQEVHELRDLESELEEIFEQMNVDTIEPELYLAIAKKLEQYVYALNLLFEFKDLAFSIANLATSIQSYHENVDISMQKKIILFLTNIVEDLSSWRDVVFVSQSAIDIHYLDSSLLSVILQIELAFSPETQDIDDDDCELELF